MGSPARPEATTTDLRTPAAAAADGAVAILLIGAGDSSRGALRSILAPAQWKIREAATFAEAVGILDEWGIAVAICDAETGDGNWQALLVNLQGRAHPPKLIVSSRLADERLWAEVLNLGGYDVLAQPFDHREVLRAAHMAWTAWRQKRPMRAAAAF